jgi:agmatine deiminase
MTSGSTLPHRGPVGPTRTYFRMPAEWEPHAATWVSWPHKESSWPGKITAVKPVFARMVAEISRSEPVHVNVNDARMEAEARALLAEHAPLGPILFHHFPTNDAWCRDHGAIFVTEVRRPSEAVGVIGTQDDGLGGPSYGSQSLLAVDWQYNAWGDKYPPYDLDNEIPRLMAEALNVPRIAVPMVLEGGSIDVNGAGTLLTTESCLLNPNRNPGMGREQIEAALRDYLGVTQILWLGDGIEGDDTDGHVDDLTRFVNPTTVVTAVESDPADANFAPLQENLARLRDMRLPDVAEAASFGPEAGSFRHGKPLKIIELPMPPRVECDGQRLPASYANFYIANSVVLLPFYGGPTDDAARKILQSCFPTREVIGIDCTDLVWGLGAFHCLTQQVPSAP